MIAIINQETQARAVCPQDCYDACAMLIKRDHKGQLIVSGDPTHPYTAGFLCIKGKHHLERFHSPQRLVTPLIRIGAKGRGMFKPITWNKAIELIFHKITEACQKFGPESVLPYSYSGTMGLLNKASMDRRFFNRLGASLLERTICSTPGGLGYYYTLGALEMPDPEGMKESKLIVLWGNNLEATSVHQLPFIFEAKKKGAKIVVINPIKHSLLSKKADLYIQPEPGTDAALAMGIMAVMAKENWVDQNFVEKWTYGFGELRKRLDEYPLEKVSKITGVFEEDIIYCAKLYSLLKPSYTRIGVGVQHHTNGGETVRCIACISALAGTWQMVGGGAGYATTDAFNFNKDLLERPDFILGNPRTINMNKLGSALLESLPPISVLFVYNSNPAVTAPNQGKVLQGLQREDLFTIVHDLFLSDTAKYADIVLPANHQFERLDLHGSFGHYYVQLNQPIFAARGQSISNTDLFRHLARAFDFKEEAFQETDEELVKQALTSDHPNMKGITYEKLVKKGWVRLSTPSIPYIPFVKGFPTPTGKIELFSTQLKEKGLDPLPGYTPLQTLKPELQAKYPLIYLTIKSKYAIMSSFADLQSLQKRNRCGEPTLVININDALERGIESGDYVRVGNNWGECILKAWVSAEIKKGVIFSEGFWWNEAYYKNYNVNITTPDFLTDYGRGASFNSNYVQIQIYKQKDRDDQVDI